MNGSRVRFTQDYVVRTPRESAIYPISEADWERLKRIVRGIVPARRVFQNLGSAALGIFGSGVLALVAFYSTPNLPAWVVPATWAITGASLVLGSGFYVLDSLQRDLLMTSTDDVIEEMKIIETHYPREDSDPIGQVTTRHLANAARRAREFVMATRVRHADFGIGTVVQNYTDADRRYVTVDFGPEMGIKRFSIPDEKLRALPPTSIPPL